MAPTPARPLPTFEKQCPADRYVGGLLRLYLCDARAVSLSRLFPARPEALPASVPVLGGLSLYEMNDVQEEAHLRWTTARTAQGVLWQPMVELAIRPDRADLVRFLEVALRVDLFIVAQPPRTGLTWAFSPMRLATGRDTGTAYSTDPLWRLTLMPAQTPAKCWYRDIPPTVTPNQPGASRGFAPGFSLGFK